MNPRTLAILGVAAVVLYILFQKNSAAPGSTYFTGSTAQPNPLSTAGGIGSLETGLAGLFSAFSAPASQGPGTVVTPANASQYPTVPLGATIPAGGSGSDFSLDDNVDYFLANQPKAIVAASGSGSGVLAPTAPDVQTAGPILNTSVLPNNSTISGSFPSLDATNQSIGYVAPPSGSIAPDYSLSLDNTDNLGLSLG